MGLFDFFKKKSNKKQTEQESTPNQDSQADFAKDITMAAQIFINKSTEKYNGLDYSVKSLAIVDAYLEDASEFYDEMKEEQKDNLIKSVGSYVFEVARKSFGGKYFWYENLNQPIFVTGQPEFEASIIAFEKVKGRLENGIEDNIPFYFNGYAERVKNKQSGMNV